MKIYSKFLVLVFSFGGFVSSSSSADFAKKEINHYSLNLPSGYLLKDKTPKMADFELYEIANKKNKAEKMEIYFGNNPSFPKYDWPGAPLTEQNNGVEKKLYEYGRERGTLEGVLIFQGLSYRKSQSPYSRIHYFAKGIDPEVASCFEKIVASIKVDKPNL